MSFLIVFILPANIYACVPAPPTSRRIDLGDGMVFYVTIPLCNYREYPPSGLYIDGELIYTIESTPLGVLYFSNDGMSFLHFIGSHNRGYRGQSTYEGLVFFYRYGELVHFFPLNALVHNPETIYAEERRIWDERMRGEGGPTGAPPRVADMWATRHYYGHNSENNTLTVTTFENRLLTFDLSTGLIISDEKIYIPEAETNGTSRLIIVAAVGVLIILLTRKSRPPTRKN